MKRAAAIIICCAMLTGTFAACGKSSSSSSEEETSVTETVTASAEADTTAENTTETDTTEAETTTASAGGKLTAGDYIGAWKLKDVISKETGKSYIYDSSEEPDLTSLELLRVKITEDKVIIETVGIDNSEYDFTENADGTLSFADESGESYTASIENGELVLVDSKETAYFEPYTETEDTTAASATTEPATKPDLSGLNGGDIVGKWTSADEESKDAFYILFNEDKTMTNIIDYSAIISFKDGKATVAYSENTETQFDGTKLVITSEGKSIFEFERVSGETSKDDIDGTYKIVSENGDAPQDGADNIIYVIIKDGSFFYCNSSFTYETDGNKLVIKIATPQVNEDRSYIYGFEGDILRIYDEEENLLSDYVRADS